MTDPLSWRDGTQAVAGPDGAADPLAPPPRAARDEAAPLPDVALGALPVLPPLPVAADHATVQRWMDADAVESRRESGPPVRQAGPVRLLPHDDGPAHPAEPSPPAVAPVARSTPRRRPGAHPRSASSPRPAAPSPRPGEASEPEWLRERREEHEFRSEFGEWRAPSAPPPPRTGLLSPVTLLVLVAVAAILVLMALG